MTAREVLHPIQPLIDTDSLIEEAADILDAVLTDDTDYPAPRVRSALSKVIGARRRLADYRPPPYEPEPLGTAREAFGAVLDIATRLTPVLAERDRLLQLVEIGLADLTDRPQQDTPEQRRELESWQVEKSLELALRWYEVEPNGVGMLARVEQVQRIMRGEPATVTAAVSKGRLDELAESWQAVADELPHNSDRDAEEVVWRTCARQLRQHISSG